MAKRDRLSGNEAVSYALRQINPDVFPAFPITPSTEIPQYFASFVANGQVDTEFIPVESEHSSMSAAIGASAAGARSLTATSSCGLALMWEELYVAASNRLPVALAQVNRALSGPININCDHSDSMGARDSGWIQIYAENNQEAYDNMVQAFRIAEHQDVRLPIMICQDGFITSHAVENIELLDDGDVKNFVGEYEPENYLLNPECPTAVGPYSVTDFYMEAKRAQAEAMKSAASNENGAMMGFMGMGMAANAGGVNVQNLYQMGAAQQAAAQQTSAQPQTASEGGWTCSCGTVNKGKFCIECGKPKPAQQGWTCSCGTINKGKFCMECGKPKPAAEPLYRCDKCGWEPADPKKPPRFCPECGDPFDSGDII